METGLSHTSAATVGESDTARALGSGDMDVLATPAMVALMENAAMLAVADKLDEGQTTVGTAVSVEHIRASLPGATVAATAVLTAVEGRRLTFNVAARDEQGIIGEGTHTRCIVERERFMAKATKTRE